MAQSAETSKELKYVHSKVSLCDSLLHHISDSDNLLFNGRRQFVATQDQCMNTEFPCPFPLLDTHANCAYGVICHPSAEIFVIGKKHYEDLVKKVNAELQDHERLMKVGVMPEEWSIEGGELTPSMKLKRRVIFERYKDRIDALYGGE